MQRHYHLVGIGGIGMSGIAQLLLRFNYKVTGSDLKESKNTKKLRSLGVEIFLGHNSENIKGADTVVYSSAIKGDNPEIEETKRLKIPLIMRAQALAELMVDKSVITVSGSHGKTTVTSLVSYLLLEAGLSPTVAIGGILKNIDTNACVGSGKFFVAEADESDGSFLFYKPKFSIITNIDHEHLDYYENFEQEIEAFRKFLNSTSKNGCVFYCSDDLNLKEIIKGYQDKFISFGLNPGADVYPKNIVLEGLRSNFDCFFKEKFVARFSLALGGEHNISNALGVIALSLELGIGLKFIKNALAGYKGALRRLEEKFKDRDYTIIDDYAHHPTEIKATLRAISNLKAKRVVAIFQPHRFTRTQLLFDEFVRSFDHANCLIITDIYSAGEQPILDVNSANLCRKIKEYAPDKEVYFVPKEEIVSKVRKLASPGDLIITLGAGDIARISDELAEKFKS
ncbi:MAG: UDP-N-acetylmuramate--L-alanine ligase [Candidatus Omnitrophota bacterium]|jgi:UDP-N-acetylmuramate--alanine ligase